jgi:hypothetical protein
MSVSEGVSASGSRIWPEGLLQFGGNFRVIFHPGVSLAKIETQPGLKVEVADRTIVVEQGIGVASRFGILFVAGLGEGSRPFLCFKRDEVESVKGADGETDIWSKQ